MKRFAWSIICPFILVFILSFSMFCVAEPELPGDSQSGESDGEEAPFDSQGGESPGIEQETTYFTTETGSDYVLYTSRNSDSNIVCMILIPYGEEADAFMKATEWTLFAAIERYNIVCISSDWAGDPDGSRDYLDEVYQDIINHVPFSDLHLFLIGYEDGADFAAEEAARNTARYTGLVTLGGTGFTDEQVAVLEDQDERLPLSVWMYAPKKTSEIKKAINYWQERNSITGFATRSYSLKGASELYLPNTSTAGKIEGNSDRMGLVMFSRESDYMDHSVSGNITRNFITIVSTNEIIFREPITGGEVFGINDFRFTYARKQFQGQQRDYWMYVPASAMFGDEAPSLVLCLHGNGGNGEDMIYRTMWHKTADENNIIMLYPSSLYKSGFQHYWQNIDEELSFLRDLVDETCEKFNIDRSHIYVTGYSNGAGMAQNLAIRCSDIFAAATLSAPVYYDAEYFGPVEDIHEVAILFSFGSEDTYLKKYDMTAAIDDLPAITHLGYWRLLYGFNQEFYSCEKRGKFTTYTYTTRFNVPVCKWIIVEGKGHTYPEDEVELYYDYMKCYSKGENGELYYYNELVQS